MASWQVFLEPLPRGVRILITDNGDDRLKALLPDYPVHPRALLTMLEGLALWTEEPLRVVISAERPCSHSLGLGHFAAPPHWPAESDLVRFEFRTPRASSLTPPSRGTGLGEFSRLRRLSRAR